MVAEAGVARAWVAHLLAGGTTGWADFADDPVDPVAEVEAPSRLPGAQQLEVLRRLNLGGRVDPGLAREVLGSAPPGRGALDLPLVGLPRREYGAPPVDPSTLGPEELLRVTTGVLADRLAATGLPAPYEPSTRDLVREQMRDRVPRRHAFRLVGPTARVDPVRAGLAALGRVPGGRRATHYVLGADTGRLVTDAWSSRVVEGAAPPWPEWLATWIDSDDCPPRADLAAIARTWSRRVGADRVEVVLDAGELAGLLATHGPLPAAPAAPAAAVELARQVSAVLGVLVERRRRTRLLAEVLVPALAGAEGPRLVVPPEHREWLRRQGRAQHADLRADGYRVHGPTTSLDDPPTDVGTSAVTGPDDDAVLSLALRTLLRWRGAP